MYDCIVYGHGVTDQLDKSIYDYEKSPVIIISDTLAPSANLLGLSPAPVAQPSLPEILISWPWTQLLFIFGNLEYEDQVHKMAMSSFPDFSK